MRFVSFTQNGRSACGLVERDRILLVPGNGSVGDLKAALAQGGLEAFAAACRASRESVARSDVQLLPVIPNPGKILCVGHNYEEHRRETGRAKTKHPSIFLRFADTLIGDGAPIVRPPFSTSLDFEGELAVVIGRGGFRVSEDDAMGLVAGYSCFNDGSVRDWQWHTQQFTPGKNFPSTGGFGPELVTPDEVGPLDDLAIETRLNGDVVQSSTFANMIFPVAEIVSYASQFTRLSPGDVIATGTPGGVGAKREPPLWLKAGDTVEITIAKVGTLRNGVVDEAA